MVDPLGILFTDILSILGWFWGRWMHRSVASGDSVYLSPLAALFFGNLKPSGAYNIRGIYFQLLSLWMFFSFTAFNLGLIPREDADWRFIAGLLIFPLLEFIRYIEKKSRK